VFGGLLAGSLDAAVAVEILHNFTLVHDDIMDNADSRRGRATIHKKWSVNEAILVGDELIGLSYRSLLEAKSKRIHEIVKVFTDGVIEVCEGQALDKEFETKADVDLDDYMTMIRKKTAELIRTSAVIGSLIADAADEEIGIISNYSQNLGIAFQIQDDLLDVTANEIEFGKKIGGDILEKKKTYLFLKSLELLDQSAGEELLMIYNSENKNEEKVRKVIGLYKRSGAVDSARNEIKNYTGTADLYLSSLKESAAKETLKVFSQMLLNRNF
jgi:geranylgeranyl diphosphate synthase type II